MSNFQDEMAKKTQEIHQWAVNKGWWAIPNRTPPTMHMLVVTELAEATEEARKETPPVYFCKEGTKITPSNEQFWKWANEDNLKPEGELIELADAVIRIMDYCGQRGWDLGEAIEMKMKYNDSRSYRHGGKLY